MNFLRRFEAWFVALLASCFGEGSRDIEVALLSVGMRHGKMDFRGTPFLLSYDGLKVYYRGWHQGHDYALHTLGDFCA